MTRLFITFIISAFCSIGLAVRGYAQSDGKRDIVLIIVDDLNDWVGCLGGHPNAKSPNIDALARNGMLFSQAYCNSNRTLLYEM